MFNLLVKTITSMLIKKITIMKKVLFTLAVLCASFWSCNTLDLNDVGYGDGDRLKASSVKEIL